jgi:hypothetical protein
MERREAMTGTATLFGAGIGLSTLGAPGPASAASFPKRTMPPTGKVDSKFISFEDPVERFNAHFRFERDLVADQGEALSWYYWIAYAVPGDQSPQPMVRFEGMEYSYFRKVAENTYRIHAHNVSYPRSLETNKFTSTVVNPISGKSVEVPPTILLEDPGTVQSPRGFRNMKGDGTYDARFTQFRLENGILKFEKVRTAPPNWPVNHMESSISSVEYDIFLDKKVTSLPFKTTGNYIFPYPAWMGMGDRGGSMLGFWDGRKLSGVGDLPDEFRRRVEREHPELLAPRWGEFDRPAPFVY